MAVVTLIVTSMCALIIRYRLRTQVIDDLTQDLKHSVTAFHDLQAERLGALDREDALLAELPTLKALMTSGDELTIQNGAVEFWQISGTDLFALTDPVGRIVAAYSKTSVTDSILRERLKELLASPGKHYLINGRSLYACSLRPLYFGSTENGTLLGYVISGVSIERTVRQISQPAGVEAVFLSNGQIVASTLLASSQLNLDAQALLLSRVTPAPSTVMIGDTPFLGATEDLPAPPPPLQLVVLKSPSRKNAQLPASTG